MSHVAGPDRAATVAEAQSPQDERRALARRILLDAVFLGGLADSLLHEGFGVGFFLWMIVAAAVAMHIGRRRAEGFTREQIGWLVTAVFFAGCFAWRDSSSLLFYDLVAAAITLLLCGATLSSLSPMRSILGQRVRDVLVALGSTIRNSLIGIVPTLRDSAVGSPRSWRRGRAGIVARAVLLALPVLLVFGVLFESADPMFGALLSLPKFDLGVVLSHVVIAGLFAWLSAGWLHGAFGDGPAAALPQSQRRMLTLSTTDVTAILGGVVTLFALFVSVQIGWLFGGERLVRSTTGLGYAEYARHGFFELVMVSLLVLPVLLGTRALIPDDDQRAVSRHRLLATPLLVLIGGVMASALGRMALYVHYYGLSTDRVYASVFMVWLAIVFAWFGLTILRGRLRDFAAGMTITGFFTLALLNAANPEALVARENIARGREALQVADSLKGPATNAQRLASPIDYGYLVRLDGDAVEEVVHGLTLAPVAPVASPARSAEVRGRCAAVRRLLMRWGPNASATDWRVWSKGASRAKSAVMTHESALRAVTCVDDAGEQPFGDRERRSPVQGEQSFESH